MTELITKVDCSSCLQSHDVDECVTVCPQCLKKFIGEKARIAN